ncbi:spermidine coumaroyl-CoA acyltransferase [Tanacetum coccineum]
MTTTTMDVKTSPPTTIHPSQPPFTDDHILPLSHLDTDSNMNVPFRYVRAYAATNQQQNTDPFDVITSALSTTLVKYYPYTGSLHRRTSDGRFELHCRVGDGVQVIPATVDFPLSSVNYLDDANEEFIELLVPNPDEETRVSNLLILQVTRFSCGGYTLGACVHHALCDGLGATLFFNAMAEVARGVSGVTVDPVWDRSSLLGPREPARTDFPIDEFLCLDKDFVPYSELSEKVVREYYHVKDDWLDQFKAFLHEKSGSNFTTFEALGAALWQASVCLLLLPYSVVQDVEAWKHSDFLCHNYVLNGLVGSLYNVYCKTTTAKELWESLERKHKTEDAGTKKFYRNLVEFL